MAGIMVGSVAVEVVPDATGFRERLDAVLSDEQVNVKANLDTGEAVAKLAALRAEMDAVSNDSGGSGGGFFSGLAAGAADANSAISGTTAAVVALAPALIPIGAAAAGGIAALGAAFASAAAGAGVAALAFSGIGAAVKALNQTSASSGASFSSMALQHLADAQSIRSAARQVTSAQQGIVTSQQQLAQSEQNLTNAVYNEQQAQLGLVDARKAAQRQLESYNQQLADGALQQRQNQLAVEQAQQTLQQTLANPLSTDLQRQQAQLAYDQAVQQQKDQSENYKNLQADAAAAAAAGVDGNQQVEAAAHKVVTAQQQVAQAHQQVQNSTTGVATAQANLADAEANLAAAHERVALQADQGSKSTNALAAAMAKLSPAGRSFAEFVVQKLEPAFDKLRDAAQTGLFPGLEAAFEQMMPVLPALTGFVGGLATTMGNLAQQAAAALTGPFWTQFFGFVSSQVGPILQTLASMFGNIATGLAGLSEAFAPVTSTILGAFDSLSGRFADFATNTAPGSPLEKFVTFVQQSLPVVGHLLENLGKAIGAIAKAGAGIGLTELRLISDFLGVVAKIPEPVLAAILDVIGPLMLAIKAFGIILAVVTPIIDAFDLAIDANPLALIIEGIIAALALLGVGIYELVEHWSTVWATMQAVVGVAWQFIDSNFVQPIEGFFSSIGGFISQHWQLILGIITGPIGLAVYFITSNFDSIVGFFAGLPGRIAAAAVHMWDGITDTFKAAINFIISIWDDLANLTSFTLPSISLGPFHAGGEHIGPLLPSIPEVRASGGPVSANAPYLVGEVGPELFVPNTSGTIVPNRQLTAAGSRSAPIIGHMSITAYNPAEAALMTASEIGWQQKTRGQ